MRITTEYIAGFVDGEAYIGLTRKSRKDCRLGFNYRPNIKIVQIKQNDEVLFKIKEQYGGYVSNVKQNPDKNMRQASMWEIANRPMVKKLISDIQPYSLVKRKQIKLLLEFINLPYGQSHKNRIYDGEKERIYWAMRAINKRGLAETKRKDTEG